MDSTSDHESSASTIASPSIIESKLETEPEPLKFEVKDTDPPKEVTWDGDNDPENPHNWPKWKKWYIYFLFAVLI